MDAAAADGAKLAIAVSFRALWYRAAFRDELETVVGKLAEKQFWRQGWRAVKQTRLFDAKDKASEDYARLSRLKVKLRPRDLVERVRGIVFMSDAGIADFDEVDINKPDSFRLAMEKKNDEATRLGAEVAKDDGIVQEVLPDIVGGKGNLFHFGRGLVRGSRRPKELWNAMEEELARTPETCRAIGAFCGMLCELSASTSEMTDECLDRSISQEPLARHFPALQGSVFIDERGGLFGPSKLLKRRSKSMATCTSGRPLRLSRRTRSQTIYERLRKHPVARVWRDVPPPLRFARGARV